MAMLQDSSSRGPATLSIKVSVSVNWLRYGNWMRRMISFDGSSQVSGSRPRVLLVKEIKEYFRSLSIYFIPVAT